MGTSYPYPTQLLLIISDEELSKKVNVEVEE